jgi:hypothetical protein
MKQVMFNYQELRRIEMIGNSTDSIGIEACSWPGWVAEPMTNGTIPIIYNADGWAIHDLIESGKFLAAKNSNLSKIAPDQRCNLNIALFKMSSFWAKRYGANFVVYYDRNEYYSGSIAACSLDALVVLMKAAIAGKLQLSESTTAAIENA